MAQVAPPATREVAVVKTLIGLTVLAALVAATAGFVLLVVAPESGSSAEATLGFTAATSGIATAVLAGAAAIYAQVRNLWQYAPTWLRVGTWLVLAVAVLSGIWNSMT